MSTGKTVQFDKRIVEAGRDPICDFLLDGKSTVARRQATFLYEKDMWFLRDNFSTNGTWINGAKIQPGKKYQLATNDEINFAMDALNNYLVGVSKPKGIFGKFFGKK